MNDGDPPLSAQVVLRPAGGAALTGAEEITAATVARYAPDPAAVATAQAFFRDAGFAVGDARGISFAITAPKARFEDVFGDELVVDPGSRAGAISVSRAGGGRELPLTRLPAEVAAALQAVAFTPPPDFGPTGHA